MSNSQAFFFDHAINSLAKVKEDVSDNKFDVTTLNVVEADGEVLDISVHQDWELLSSKTSRVVSGQNQMDVDCNSKSNYNAAINKQMSSVYNNLPSELLTKFKESEPFCHCEDFFVDTTSIGFIDTCSPCGGSGKVSCRTCGGSGTITKREHVGDNVTYETENA